MTAAATRTGDYAMAQPDVTVEQRSATVAMVRSTYARGPVGRAVERSRVGTVSGGRRRTSAVERKPGRRTQDTHCTRGGGEFRAYYSRAETF
jgi:hypothetical protein